MTSSYQSLRLILGLAAALIELAGCGHSSPTAAGPVPQTVSVIGSGSLHTIGETSQLSAFAVSFDGTSQNVTSNAQWTSQDPSIVAVSPNGLLTAVRFGATTIAASYAGVTGSTRAAVLAAGTFVVFGWVREPGGGPIGGAQVLDTRSGMVTVTNADYGFSLAGLTSAHLTVTKERFEPSELDLPQITENVDVGGIPLQRVIRIDAGQTAESTIRPHDMDFTMSLGEHCYPCRRIRVVNPGAGTLRLRLTWTEPKASMALWIDGRRLNSEASGVPEVTSVVNVAAGELSVDVGVTSGPGLFSVPFTLATSAGSE